MGISLGLVGLGSFGSSFARLFKNHPLVDRVGLCDREPERVARFAEDPSFSDKFTTSDVYESFKTVEFCIKDVFFIMIGSSLFGAFLSSWLILDILTRNRLSLWLSIISPFMAFFDDYSI